MPPPSTPSSDRWILSWSPGTLPENKLPANVTRSFIGTPNGLLELLSADPRRVESCKPPVLFAHGGFGCAETYSNFLTYFSNHGYPCHALSIRGHGHSWKPSYFRMVFLTTARMLATDVAAGVNYIRKLHGRDPILVGHSNGGGLSQIVLDRGLAKAAGLVILAGTPNFGGFGVYTSWCAMDPWFLPRVYLRDWFHPRSPLSSTKLVHQAFFCPEFPVEEVRPFERLMSEYESYLWPVNIMYRFVDAKRVLLACRGQLLVLAAERDRLMALPLMKRTSEEYKQAAKELAEDKKVSASEQAVQFKIVERSGHHLQNDLQWKDAAAKLLAWMDGLEGVD